MKVGHGYIIGNIPPTVHKPISYFSDRHCFVDCRGKFEMSASADFGYGVRVITHSHDISEGYMGTAVSRTVILKDKVWVGSFSILYNCLLEEGVVVSTGAVVSGVHVPAHSLLEGNPAMIVATYNNELKKWVKLEQPVKPERWRG